MLQDFAHERFHVHDVTGTLSFSFVVRISRA
jgi:hypothetical protein